VERCEVCRRALSLEDRTTLTAAGRVIGPAHKTCAALVTGGLGVLARLALAAGDLALKRRYPRAYAAFAGAKQALQEHHQP